jgi:hypothetical protein
MADILEGYITERDFAAQRGVSRRTLQRERQLRIGPPFVVMGRRVFYRIDGIKKWLTVHEVNSIAGRERAPDDAARIRGAFE